MSDQQDLPQDAPAPKATAAPETTDKPKKPKKRPGPKPLPKNDDGPPREPMGIGCALGDPLCEGERVHDWERIRIHPGSESLNLCARHRQWYEAGRRLGP